MHAISATVNRKKAHAPLRLPLGPEILRFFTFRLGRIRELFLPLDIEVPWTRNSLHDPDQADLS